jgi:hypothetical protein
MTIGWRDALSELAYPARSGSALLALLTFTFLLWLSSAAGMLGLWLMIVTVPAVLRYLTMIAEARARGRDVSPPGIEYFSLVGNVWALFPVIPVLLAGSLVHAAGNNFGDMAASVPAAGFAALFPAHIAVLLITQSPLQSVDPRAIAHFIRRCGKNYWYAPPLAVMVVAVPMTLGFLPGAVGDFIELYLAAAFFAVTGAVTRGSGLFDDIDLPDATEADPDAALAAEAANRRRVLDHAYGFVSRGNRVAGLEHIYASLRDDPDPDEAWRWYLQQMLDWQDSYPALLLAQQYLGRLLACGDQVAAVKLMLRCRLVDATFRPLTADLEQAIAAAEACDNRELVEELSRRR